MNWRIKAAIQHSISCLPRGMSLAVYRGLQRSFGGLRKPNPTRPLMSGIGIAVRMRQHFGTGEPELGTVLELGTGPSLSVAWALWLCGARRVITVDQRPLVRDVVLETQDYLRHNRAELSRLFSGHVNQELFEQRLSQLLSAPRRLSTLIDLTNVDYRCPADGSALPLEDNSVDCHASVAVLEHMAPQVAEAVVAEARRVTRRGGLMAHWVDLADHFAYGDASISKVNFLKYSEHTWRLYGANRFMYHNRMRCDELKRLFESGGLKVTELRRHVDPTSLAVLIQGAIRPAPRFAENSPQVNATTELWICATEN